MSKKANKNEEAKQEKYYYVKVHYDDTPENTMAYNYISKNLKIKINDRVLVPRGDSQATGHVVDCGFFSYDDVPYPVEYTKYVIKKIDEDFKLDMSTTSVPKVGSFYDQLNEHIVTENGRDQLKDFDVDKFRNKVDDSNIKYVEGFVENVIPLVEDRDLKLFVIGTMRNLNSSNIYESVYKIEEFYKGSDHCTKSISNEVIDELIAILQTYEISNNPGKTTTEEKLKQEKEKICDLYFKFALALILYPKNVELVKLGICMIGIFKFDEEDEIMELFWNLSLCEELAKYLAFLFANQDDAEKFLLKAAKQSSGWGRINYIEKFNFANYEMLDWVLAEGYDNDIDSLYTSALVVQKVDLISILNNCIKAQNGKNKKEAEKAKQIIRTILHIFVDLNEEPNSFQEFEAENSIYPNYDIDMIMDIMIDLKESLKYYPQYYLMLLAYVNYINEKEAQIIDGVNSIESEGPSYSQIVAEKLNIIDEVFHSFDFEENLKKIIKQGSISECEEVCRLLPDFPELDVGDELMAKFAKHPLEMFLAFSYLMFKEEYRNQAFQIMKKAQDWSVFKGEPEPIVDHKAVDLKFVINDLELYPFYGEYFVNLGLNSYDWYCRHAALCTLTVWKEETQRPIYKFSSKIIESLINLKTKEVMKENKELIADLLSDLKDLREKAQKEQNEDILKMLNIVLEDEDLENYKDPKVIYK